MAASDAHPQPPQPEAVIAAALAQHAPGGRSVAGDRGALASAILDELWAAGYDLRMRHAPAID